jgi:hypothetical protein
MTLKTNRRRLVKIEESKTVPEGLLSAYHVGQSVVHEKFGLGEITELRGFKATVRFGQDTHVFDIGSGLLQPLDATGPFTITVKGLTFRRRPSIDELEVLSCNAKYVGEIDIPDSITIEGRMFRVTAIGESAFANRPGLRSVSIPPSVTLIAPNAFERSENVAQIKKISLQGESVTAYINASGKWGIIANPAKKISAIPGIYDEIRPYAGKLVEKQKTPILYFLVKEKGLWGVLNKIGHQQAPCIYNELNPIETRGLFQGFVFKRGDISGILDGKGEETLE